MSFRTVNGSTHTEDGWRCCNRDECDLVRIPDLFLTETAPLRKGAPLVILGAWLYWYDRNVEEITSSVWGWSLNNDVLGGWGANMGSNHLSGTAVDVNAPKYPWGTYRMSADKIAKVEEGRRLFSIDGESGIAWGRKWSKPDEMHYQMAWREGDPRNDRLAQKLLDGYLGIYRAGPTPPPALSQKDRYALATINEGKRLGITPKGIKIALAVELVETNLTMYSNVNVPGSDKLPHEKVGSDHDSTGLFQQRQAWGPLSCTMDPTCSARLFFTGGQAGQRGLTDFPYNTDARTPGGWAQAVQVSKFPDRYDKRYPEAEQIYDRLVNITTGDEDEMAGWDPTKVDRAMVLLENLAGVKRKSRSPLHWPHEGEKDTVAGLAWTTDANVHIQLVEKLAVIYGDPLSIALLIAVKNSDDPTNDPALAARILRRVSQAYLDEAKAEIQKWLNAEARHAA